MLSTWRWYKGSIYCYLGQIFRKFWQPLGRQICLQFQVALYHIKLPTTSKVIVSCQVVWVIVGHLKISILERSSVRILFRSCSFWHFLAYIKSASLAPWLCRLPSRWPNCLVDTINRCYQRPRGLLTYLFGCLVHLTSLFNILLLSCRLILPSLAWTSLKCPFHFGNVLVCACFSSISV